MFDFPWRGNLKFIQQDKDGSWVSQKVISHDKGGGAAVPPKEYDIICEQPSMLLVMFYLVFNFFLLLKLELVVPFVRTK